MWFGVSGDEVKIARATAEMEDDDGGFSPHLHRTDKRARAGRRVRTRAAHLRKHRCRLGSIFFPAKVWPGAAIRVACNAVSTSEDYIHA